MNLDARRFVALLQPKQLNRVIVLIKELKEIRDSVLYPARFEPRLSLRRNSSLDPRAFEGLGHEMGDDQ